MKLGRWSTTAANNNATPPDGFPEGQAASTLNDAAREVMASIRTVFNDAQFFDQDMTPTQVGVTSFTVPGDQTSAIHAGRRLKLFDASTMYATVATASFTAVTTIHVVTDSGSNLTTSLSSFAIGILSKLGIPDGGSISVAAANVVGSLSVGGNVAIGGTLTVSGSAVIGGTLRVSATVTAAAVIAANLPKAWVRFDLTSTASITPIIRASYNVSSVSRSATGTYRVNFTNPLADTSYSWCLFTPVFISGTDAQFVSVTAASFKFTYFVDLGPPAIVDSTGDDRPFNLFFFR